MTRRIAVIGAGIAGSLIALDLSRHGYDVDLFDRNPEGSSEASYFNEGKIHLGFLYAHDRSRDTSRLMIEGAARFRRIIMELADFDVSAILSTPFLYAVHRDSLIESDEFERHLARCCQEFAVEVSSNEESLDYVNGQREVTARRLLDSEWKNDLDPSTFRAVFQTDERSVDPRQLAPIINSCVESNGRISLNFGTRVDRVQKGRSSKWQIIGVDETELGRGSYDVVVNATWSDLLRLDSQVGIHPPKDWSYRYKLGNRIHVPLESQDISSVTVVLGAFGDIVNFGQRGGAFVSWYPSGRLMMTSAIDLPDWNGEGFQGVREEAFRNSLAIWENLSRKMKDLQLSRRSADSRGGMILATGRIDVDDPSSPLHSRVQVGVQTMDTYVSVNTGKFTLAPLMAIRASDKVRELLA